MNALAMPISSRTAEDMPSACLAANSLRIFEERSATCWQTFASSSASFGLTCCIAHDAIIATGTLRTPGVVEVVQVGYRLAHRKEGLVGVERAAEQDGQQLRCAFWLLQRLNQFTQSIPM